MRLVMTHARCSKRVDLISDLSPRTHGTRDCKLLKDRENTSRVTPREFELAVLIQVAQHARSRDQSPTSAIISVDWPQSNA